MKNAGIESCRGYFFDNLTRHGGVTTERKNTMTDHYCDYKEEEVTDYDCRRCDMTDCEHHPENVKAEVVMLNLAGSEILQELRTQLESSCLPTNRIDTMIDSLIDMIQNTIQSNFEKLVKAYAHLTVSKFWTDKMIKKADEQIEVAMTEKVLEFSSDGKAHMQSIQKILGKRIARHFSSKDSRGREIIEETIGKAIENQVATTVNEAFEELKEETITKYNKEAIKHMMQILANGIRDDKRLMELMTESDK